MKEITSGDPEIMQHAVIEEIEQAGNSAIIDNFRSDFYLKRELPSALGSLDKISQNFAWSWLTEGVDVFRDLDASLWDECEQNPRLLLKNISDLRLWQRAADSGYLDSLRAFEKELDSYLAADPAAFGQVNGDTPAAYFCAEYGIHHSLPNYSGGLGILAGDHLKSASDLNVPLVALGLLYRYGYFRQRIAHDGWQEESYQDIFESEIALLPVLDEDGRRILVSVRIRGREVQAQAWLAQVGRVSLFLLDSNVPENSEVDRMITGHLYGGDSETRIVQEKLLGIGGVRLLRKLDITPSVYHLNEGHSAFLTLELASEFLRQHPEAQFDEAVNAIKSKCVFTTHTPVDAGNDTFDPGTLRACFSSEFIASLKISDEEFLGLGRIHPSNTNEFFGMTPLALRMCRSANGVSEKHGEVSRRLWHKMFPEIKDDAQVPIKFVTNGVHPQTWIAPAYKRLYEDHIGPDWDQVLRDRRAWEAAIEQIPDEAVWRTHQTLKNLLVAFARERCRSQETGPVETINEHYETHSLLSPEVLTIGFARRVAAYKRWDLILSDLDRLLRMVDDPHRPIQFVFAGKAHPQDNTAKKILQHLMSINHESKWQKRAVFIQDYDQEIARYMIRGVDVWMNVPRRPLEASGTSGEKAAMNGILNFSILDGWWIEGYNGQNGFAIGPIEIKEETEMDAEDAESLYATLENQIIPTFYDIDAATGVPLAWVAKMKNALATLTPEFSSDRMVSDYLEHIYSSQ
jgi:starch phosphorylase